METKRGKISVKKLIIIDFYNRMKDLDLTDPTKLRAQSMNKTGGAASLKLTQTLRGTSNLA